MKKLLVLFLLLMSCGKGEKTAGRTVETTNGFAGIVKHASLPVAYAHVEIFADNDFSGVAWAETTTDSEGYFEFTQIPQGKYRLIATHKDFKGQINPTVSEEIQDIDISVDKTTTILLKTKDLPIENGMRVGLPGTKIWQDIDSTNLEQSEVILEGIPLGTWESLLYGYPHSQAMQNLLREPLQITPETPDTIVIEMPSNLIAHWQGEHDFDSAEGILIDIPSLLDKPQSITLHASITAEIGTAMEITSLGNNVGLRSDVNDSTISFYAYYSYDAPNAWHILGGQMSYMPGTPLNVTLVVDPGEENFSLYLNGKIMVQATPSEAIAYNKRGQQLSIGRHALDEDFNFSGTINSVSWWNTALSEQQIQELSQNISIDQ
ncbi:MAG: hypothetical protein GX801_10115 [Fibrobacter sp.]|nr:hypothetical protein [Fibrobacter sp.]